MATTTRKNQKSLTAAEKQDFVEAVQDLIDEGAYGDLVAIHGDMSHDMHSMDDTGQQRFLPWHRAFLIQLETKLQEKKPSLGVPYWDWQHERSVPKWLRGFQPTVSMPDGSLVTVTRYSKHGHFSLPLSSLVETLFNVPEYTPFTATLEQYHNNVHMFAGGIHGGEVGTMGDISISPADPLFWLHHSNLDRLWARWQTNHADSPDLSGAKRIFDPWPLNVDQVKQTSAIPGHAYQYQT